jgi:hypothetical protein
MNCVFCGINVLPIKECNSRKTNKSLRMRCILEKQFGGKNIKENQKPACRSCDSILNVIGNCGAALKIYIHLGEKMKLSKGSPAAIGYIRKFT